MKLVKHWLWRYKGYDDKWYISTQYMTESDADRAYENKPRYIKVANTLEWLEK